MESCGSFWFQPTYALGTIESIHDQLNHGELEPFQQHSDIKLGQIVAANFPDNGNRVDFHRGKIISINADKRREPFTVCNADKFEMITQKPDEAILYHWEYFHYVISGTIS